jgi:hypothetical protein
MLISLEMHADENDTIEVLDASDSWKLNNIPKGKRVIAQFMGSAQPCSAPDFNSLIFDIFI